MGLMYSGVVIAPGRGRVLDSGRPLRCSHRGRTSDCGDPSPLIVLLLSCLLGWVVAKISLKLKHKSFIDGAGVASGDRRCTISFYFKAQTVISRSGARMRWYTA